MSTEGLWKDAMLRCVVSQLKDERAGFKALLAEQPESPRAAFWKEKVAELSAKIEKREKDPRYGVIVRHVGSLEQPFLHDQIVAEEVRARFAAEKRAREQLAAEGRPIDDQVVRALVQSDQVWLLEQQRLGRRWLEEGLCVADKNLALSSNLISTRDAKGVADAAIARFHALGGSRLVGELVYEVKAFQSFSDEEGEG